MEKTFQVRRDLVVKGTTALIDIKDKYPFLFSKSGLLEEYKLIMNAELHDTFLRKLDKVALKIFNLPPKRTEVEGLVELRELCENANDLRDKAGKSNVLIHFSLHYPIYPMNLNIMISSRK